MTIVVYTAPATEALTVADVIAHLRIDESGAEPPPSAVTAALASPVAPGNVDNGAHRYAVTFVTSDGETQAGTASAAVTVVDKTVNGQISLTSVPIGGSAVTSRKIYRTIAGGAIYYLLATIANNTATTYTDNIADASLGVQAPTTNTTLDPLLLGFIKTARLMAEQELHRYLVTQTLDMYLDWFPMNAMPITLPPLQTVTAITYFDANGVEQTLAITDYAVNSAAVPARIAPAYGVSWPSTREQMQAVKIRFVAGYGAASAVPQCIKDWMLFKINTLWETRTQFTISTGRAALTQIPNQYIDSLVDSERVGGRIS